MRRETQDTARLVDDGGMLNVVAVPPGVRTSSIILQKFSLTQFYGSGAEGHRNLGIIGRKRTLLFPCTGA